jgi:hypothetical protein
MRPTQQPAPWRLTWAFGLSSLWGTLALGQIYTFLALLTGLAARLGIGQVGLIASTALLLGWRSGRG